jgi:hypothetical protein
MQEIKERGFHLLNQIHIAAIQTILQDLNIINNGGDVSKATPT